jgi:hypothetical protein
MTASYTSLIVTIRDTARPISTELYVARFDDETGILTALGDGDKRRTDYTLAEVEQALARAQVLEAEARALRSRSACLSGADPCDTHSPRCWPLSP